MASVKHALLTSLVAFPLLTACATNPYGGADIGQRTMGGALIGAAVGALGGHAAGVDPITGAAVGMVAGGAIGAATTAHVGRHRHYYRDTRGYCYYIDENGQAQYDLNVTC
jgi:phage tail tape-measure protein